MKKISSVINRVSVFLTTAFWTVIACADYNINAPTTGPFARAGAFVQDTINVIDSTFAYAFAFFSLVGLAILWAFSPRTPIMGTVFRVVVAIIIILNVGVWIVALDS